MNRVDETFLSRWSRLKREDVQPDEKEPVPQPDQAVEKPAEAGDPGDSRADAARAAGLQRTEALEDLESVDIEALDFSSDYTRFMQSDVPDELRNKALRKLWASEPLFAYVDGFDAYCEDFTDAACVAPGLKTAYKIGRGFLSDEEVLAWENLDKPQERDAVAGTRRTVAATAPAGGGGDSESKARVETGPSRGRSDARTTARIEPDPASGAAESEGPEPASATADGAAKPAEKGVIASSEVDPASRRPQ